MTLHLRAASPRPASFDPQARTVEAIVSTGADVDRGGHVERLDLSGVDLARLIGAPVLDAHRSGSTRDQLGVVEAAELRPEGLWCRLKFRGNDAAQAVLADIGEGTLRGLSIGYSVARWRETREAGRKVRTALNWRPVEISVVPVPADPGAHFRNGETTMPDPAETTETTTAQTTAETVTRAAVNAEIRTIAETAGLTRSWADAQIDAEASAEDARAAAFAQMRQRAAATATRSARAEIITDHADPQVIATRAGEALFARSNPGHQLSEAARPYAYMSFADHAREALRRSGIPATGLSADAILTRALHSTADFPLLLGDAVGRELRQAYQAAPSGVRQLARQTTARDFRLRRKIGFGDAPALEKVAEGGEFKHGSIGEEGEAYRLETFGRIWGITRQAMVNDDLGAFVDVTRRMGIAAREAENKGLVTLVTGNPVLSDGKAVFHADHGNLTATYAAPSVAAIGAARLAMRRMKGIGGQPIDVTPAFLLVPPELETTAEQVLAEIAAAKVDDVNPFTGKLKLLVDARLENDEQWFLVADPAAAEGIEFANLEGQPGPTIETRQGFEVDGLAIKVRLDFGAGWVDWRGWHRVG